MIGWIYLAGGLLTWAGATYLFMEWTAQDVLRIRKTSHRWGEGDPAWIDRPLLGDGDRAFCIGIGFLNGTVWPIAIVALGIIFLLGRVTTPTERRLQQEKELKDLRELARKHDLPMPEEKS